MRADEAKRLCQEAQVYYYDFLCQDDTAVPESVSRHIAACPACQEQIRRLREALFEAQRDPSPAGSWDDETIEALAQQFQLLDEHVACSDVKSFLPELALPSPRIRIPTPVTVHIDHCPECAKDLAALRELDLTTDQLRRLGRLFESLRGQDSMGVRQAPAGAAALDCLSVDGSGVACNDITRADLFDCAFPSGVSPGERHKVVAAHLRICPTCLEKSQTLQRRIGTILERADSETSTVYHAESDAEDAHQAAGDLHPYPIDVQVLHGESGSSTGGSHPSTARAVGRRGSRWFAGLFTKAAVVAIALAALLMLRWINAPTASGTNVGNMLQVLAEVPSVYVLTTDRYDKPIQELWIDYRSNRMMMKNADVCVLYDLDHCRKRTIDPVTGAGPPEKLSRTQRDRVRQMMAERLRDTMARVSLDATLHPPTGDFGSVTGGNLDVYEKTWALRTRGVSVRSGLRVYVDPATGLPQKTESYQEMLGETQWNLATRTVFTYPSEQEMDRSIQEFFPDK
jgi:hypothetical protein